MFFNYVIPDMERRMQHFEERNNDAFELTFDFPATFTKMSLPEMIQCHFKICAWDVQNDLVRNLSHYKRGDYK
jgi:hypothetical protein